MRFGSVNCEKLWCSCSNGLALSVLQQDSDEDPLPKHSRERSSKRKSRKFDAGLNKYYYVMLIW